MKLEELRWLCLSRERERGRVLEAPKKFGEEEEERREKRKKKRERKNRKRKKKRKEKKKIIKINAA